MCLRGLIVSRPAYLAVGSPKKYAAYPCEISWSTTDIIKMMIAKKKLISIEVYDSISKHFSKKKTAKNYTEFMKTCPITHKGSKIQGSYLNRTRATQFNPCGKSRSQVNLQKKTIFVPELSRS